MMNSYRQINIRDVTLNLFQGLTRCRTKFGMIILAALLILLTTAYAEIYQWTDDEGVVNVTDDPTKIPDKYWIEKRVKKEVKPAPPETETPRPVQPTVAPQEKKTEFYGDYPLDWWVYKFGGLRKNIADNGEKLAKEKDFITVFEGGRKHGTLFTKEEISRYESYKTDVPLLEDKLKKLKEELEELQRKAKIAGVPKNIRE